MRLGRDRGADAVILTVGVYGFDVDAFLTRLRTSGAGLLVDVRQRRGVRGPEYAWANSRRLQAALTEAGIDYEHRPELAPTTELRRLQYAEDDRRGVGKRTRRELADEYVRRYTAEILDGVDLAPLMAAWTGRGPAALLCVEAEPAACHRSVIAHRLATEHDVPISHLRP